MMVRFFNLDVPDRKATKELGRKVNKTVEMIEIQFPGNSKFKPQFPAHEEAVTFSTLEDGQDDRRTWAERFPEAYRAFRTGGDQTTGTPLDELTQLTRAQIAMLNAMDITTLEQVSEIADHNMKKMPIDYDMREQARALLDERAEAPDAGEMASELAELRAEIARMKADKPKRGRPPKAEAETEEVDAA